MAENSTTEDENIDWHPGFVNAIKLEFFENEKDLEYVSEKNLNQQPLRIDLLVVKKNQNVKIKNEIGEEFLGHNILEFKSEDDELNIDTLYKVLAYACLYKSYGKTVDEIKAKDITATILRKRKPVKLFKYFEENKNAVTKVHNGIYRIDGFYFPIQIIVTGELSQENHTWVSSIARKLSNEQLKKVIEEAKLLNSKQEKMYASSVLNVISRLNTEEIERIKGDFIMGKTLYEIMQPEIDEAKSKAREEGLAEGRQEGLAEGRQKGLAEGRQEGLKEGLKEGVLTSLLKSVKSLMKNLNISMEQAMNSLSIEPEYRSKIIAMMN